MIIIIIILCQCYSALQYSCHTGNVRPHNPRGRAIVVSAAFHRSVFARSNSKTKHSHVRSGAIMVMRSAKQFGREKATK